MFRLTNFSPARQTVHAMPTTASCTTNRREASVAKLKKLLQDEKSPRDAVWLHQVGSAALQVHRMAAGRRYGEGVLKTLAADVGHGCTALLLYRSRSAAAVFKRADVRRWQKAMQEAGSRLTGRHLWRLASVADAKERDRIIKKCCQKGWSAEELDRQIYGRFGSRRRNAGGKPRAPQTTSPTLAVRQLARLARRLRVYGDEWLKDDGGVLPLKGTAEPKEILLREVESALQEVPEAIKALQRFEKYLRATERQRPAGTGRKRSD